MTAPAPLVWRLPPWQPALLFGLAAVAAAVGLYVTHGLVPRLVPLGAAVVFALAGAWAARMFMVVDDEGIGIRRLVRQDDIPWSAVNDVVVVYGRFNRLSLAIAVLDARELVPVPPTLLLPNTPTTTQGLEARLTGIARQIVAYGDAVTLDGGNALDA